MFIAIPIAISQLTDILLKLPNYFSKLTNIIKEILFQIQNSPDHPLSKIITPSTNLHISLIEENISNLSKITFNIAEKLLDALFNSSLSLIHIVSTILLTPVLTFYITRDWSSMLNHINQIVPPKYNNYKKQFDIILLTISKYIKGQTLICIILALLYSILLSIISVPSGFIIGIFNWNT